MRQGAAVNRSVKVWNVEPFGRRLDGHVGLTPRRSPWQCLAKSFTARCLSTAFHPFDDPDIIQSLLFDSALETVHVETYGSGEPSSAFGMTRKERRMRISRTEEMGKVVVKAKIENLEDLFKVEQGQLERSQVRVVEVDNALVDTGATTLLLPKKHIDQLGLRSFRTRHARGLGGSLQIPMYSTVRLTIQGRDCSLDMGEVSDDFPVLIGQVPLELLDWVVDPRGQKLIGNPDHGGEQMVDVF